MRSVKLRQVLEVQNGFAFKTEFFNDVEGTPLVRIRDLETGKSETRYSGIFRDEFLVMPGDYLVGMDGNFRCVRWAGGQALLNQRVCRLQNFTSDVLPEYVFYGIQPKLKFIEDSTSFATVKHISAKQILDIELPLPSLAEQHRIVDLLSRAEGIVRLRREAQQKAAKLIPAIFIDMFGDPATNSKRWPLRQLGDVGSLDRGRSRHRPRDAAFLYDGPYPFIQTGDVANSRGRIRTYGNTYSEAGLAQSRLWRSGTLCISIAANIAKTGVLEFDACFPDSVVGFVPGNSVRVDFVQAWLGFLQPALEANAPRAAQKNINLEILRNLPIPIPPIELQHKFSDICERIASISHQQTVALDAAKATFSGLLAKSFSEA